MALAESWGVRAIPAWQARARWPNGQHKVAGQRFGSDEHWSPEALAALRRYLDSHEFSLDRALDIIHMDKPGVAFFYAKDSPMDNNRPPVAGTTEGLMEQGTQEKVPTA
jgi:hypothetical protein